MTHRVLFLLPLAIMAAVLFSGCTRISDEQAAHLAQARADAEAALAVRGDAMARDTLFAAAAARLFAGTADLDLPAPAVAASALVDKAGQPQPVAVEQERKDAEAAAGDPPTGIGWGGWLAGAGLAALGLCRFVPGAGGMVANLAWNILAPKADRMMDRKAHQLYQHGAAVVQYGVEMASVAEQVAPDVAQQIQRKAVEVQERLGVRSVVADLVTAAKAQAARTGTTSQMTRTRTVAQDQPALEPTSAAPPPQL